MALPDLPENPDAIFDTFPAMKTDEWLQLVARDLDTDDPRGALTYDTGEGISLRAVYRSNDAEAQPLDLHFRAEGMLQYERISARVPSEAVQQAHTALENGAHGLNIALPDGTRWAAPDVERLLDEGIPDGAPIHLDLGAATPALAALFASGSAPERVEQMRPFSLAFDLTAYLARNGTFPDAAAEWASDLASWPLAGRSLAADARPHHEAGATMVDELAALLASGTETLHHLTEAGHEAHELISQFQYIIPVGTSYLLEVAKLRALRVLHEQWAAAYLDEWPPAFIFAEPATRIESRCDPQTNLLRQTSAIAAAVVGGADAVSPRPFDELSGSATPFSQRLARDIPLILRHETDMATASDPARGAYFIEAATRQLASAAWTRFQQIEDAGGLVDALASGRWQDELAASRFRRLREVETRARILVGTNSYPDPGAELLPASEISEPRTDRKAGRKISDRKTTHVGHTWSSLLDAAAAGATLDELTAALSSAPSGIRANALSPMRLAEPFEELRERAHEIAERRGRRPSATVVPFGPAGLRSARANFSRNYLGAGGFAVRTADAADSPGESLEAATSADSDVIILCGPDKAYPEVVRGITDRTPARERPLLVVAGRPPSDGALSGVDAFIHRNSNAAEILTFLLRELE